MDYRLNIENIRPAWKTCDHELMVSVEGFPCNTERSRYILETLKKWFGEAEYFWNNTFLCVKKHNF